MRSSHGGGGRMACRRCGTRDAVETLPYPSSRTETVSSQSASRPCAQGPSPVPLSCPHVLSPCLVPRTVRHVPRSRTRSPAARRTGRPAGTPPRPGSRDGHVTSRDPKRVGKGPPAPPPPTASNPPPASPNPPPASPNPPPASPNLLPAPPNTLPASPNPPPAPPSRDREGGETGRRLGVEAVGVEGRDEP